MRKIHALLLALTTLMIWGIAQANGNARLSALGIIPSMTIPKTIRGQQNLLAEFDRKFIQLERKLQKNVIKSLDTKNAEEQLVLGLGEREDILKILKEYKRLVTPIKMIESGPRINVTSDKKERLMAMIAKIMLYGSSARMLGSLSKYPGTFGVLMEHNDVDGIPSTYFQDLMRTTIGQLKRSQTRNSLRRSNRHRVVTTLHDIKDPSIADIVHFKDDLANLMRWYEVPRETSLLISHYLDTFLESSNKMAFNAGRSLGSKAWHRWFYYPKEKILTWLGDIGHSGKNLITDRTVREYDAILEPGDFAVVNKDLQLSNLVFTGLWSHGMMYIGDYNKTFDFFKDDKETNDYYAERCHRDGFPCHDFIGYLENKYREHTHVWKNEKHDGKPMTIVEAVSEGVIFSPSGGHMLPNRIAAFRPKLSKREKAMALEVTFDNIGKAYDFNFDFRTYGKIVCTELILTSYLPNKNEGKSGLPWVKQVVAGTPVSYAYDLVRTHFRDNSTEFLFYYESPASETTTKRMTREDLMKTVDLDELPAHKRNR